MNDWILLIITATAGSLISLIGGLYLIYGKKGTRTLQLLAVPFAAGALLAASFLDLLPEAIAQSDAETVLLFALCGLLTFFLIERSLGWFHHHHDDTSSHSHNNVWTIIVGDTLHNFIDGLAIGAAFLISPATGVVAAIAVATHEIPQELGDFGLMLSRGVSKRKVLLVNLLSALATVVGAIIVFGFGDSLPIPQSILLAVTAGFFIYIAASDIIPGIHSEPKRRTASIQAAVLIFGVVLVGVTSHIAHSFVPHGDNVIDHSDHDHEHSDNHSH